MNIYRIVLADDHVMFRHGVKRIIEDISDIEVIGEAGDGIELLALLKKSKPDMIILDISMPNLRGIEATQEIKAVNPKIRILILTMHKDKEYLYRALSAGAEGYLLKEDADTELLAAIEAIRKGKPYVSRFLSDEMIEDLVQKSSQGRLKSPIDPLTVREREVLKLIAEGKENKEIAGFLCISVRTVEHHRSNMMRKLNLKKTAELVKYAIKRGYTSAVS